MSVKSNVKAGAADSVKEGYQSGQHNQTVARRSAR